MKMPIVRWTLALLLGILVAGCDAGGLNVPDTNTIVLNDPSNPTQVTYSFRYTPDDVNGQGVIEALSEGRDNLGDILAQYGFRRSDIVAAQVSNVVLTRISNQSTAKVFPYLTSANVYLQGPNGPHIARQRPLSSEAQVELRVLDASILSVLQEDPARGYLELEVADPSSIPSSGDRVEVTITYRIEVPQP